MFVFWWRITVTRLFMELTNDPFMECWRRSNFCMMYDREWYHKTPLEAVQNWLMWMEI